MKDRQSAWIEAAYNAHFGVCGVLSSGTRRLKESAAVTAKMTDITINLLSERRQS
jgi:hypothetical protein